MTSCHILPERRGWVNMRKKCVCSFIEVRKWFGLYNTKSCQSIIIALFGWTTLPHFPYSPDSLPSVYHPFGSMKDLRGKYSARDGELKTAVMKWPKEQLTEFYEAVIHTLNQRWNIAIERDDDYVNKKGCDPQRTRFILMYDTCSSVGNYSYTKEKGITFFTHPCIYIYICSHPQTDCFVVSKFFNVARHVGRLKQGSKPAQLYFRLSIRPLGQQAYHVS